MGTPFVPYPGNLPAPVPGPGTIFTDGILDFPGDIKPILPGKVDVSETGLPRVHWPSILRLFNFTLTWTYTSRTLAESIITEFQSIGIGPFDYVYPGDGHTYRCYWVNEPNIHPVEYVDLWIVRAELIGIRVL